MKIESPLAPLTSRYQILLGSKSPRRKELLEQLCIPFQIVSIDGVQEIYPESMQLDLVPQYLSTLKFNGYKNSLKDNQLLITADTVVIDRDKILGKPKDEADAISMLTSLAGHTHKVVTGVTLGTTERQITFSAQSEVNMGPLSQQEIEYYVQQFHPLDKAGAYGIQEWIGCVAVEYIDGSFYNVMGLPVYRLYRELLRFRF